MNLIFADISNRTMLNTLIDDNNNNNNNSITIIIIIAIATAIAIAIAIAVSNANGFFFFFFFFFVCTLIKSTVDMAVDVVDSKDNACNNSYYY